MKLRTLAAGASALALLTVTMPALAKDYFLASGRWDNVVLVIDPEKALDPANDATPNAIVNRLRVTRPILTEMAPASWTRSPAPANHHHDRA